MLAEADHVAGVVILVDPIQFQIDICSNIYIYIYIYIYIIYIYNGFLSIKYMFEFNINVRMKSFGYLIIIPI